jgi:hypothetical protein
MQNGDNHPRRGGLSSRAESEAINHPIIEEFAPLFHHILANLHLSLGLRGGRRLCAAFAVCFLRRTGGPVIPDGLTRLPNHFDWIRSAIG